MTYTIGPVKLDNNVMLAPMAGVTDMPYRRLVKSFGVGLVVSEMIAGLPSTSKSVRLPTPPPSISDDPRMERFEG